ncbi:MAG: LLM class F420-dependent oxidoreductase [Promethearchaeota archaeon]
MKIGLQIPNFTFPGGATEFASTLKSIVETAEKTGFYSIWVMDHYFQLGPRGILGPAEDPMHEGYSLLSYIAGLTSRVKLGTLVTGVIYRYPGVLVKTVTSLDVLSKGRAYFGVGAAWFEREAIALGVPFPPLKERFEQLEETLQIAKQMWSDNNGEYRGKHYKLKETLCNPSPLSKPHPPILIGGMGPTKTLKFVAQYADACNLFAAYGLDKVKESLSILKNHCKNFNRPFEEIEKTTLSSVYTEERPSSKEIIEHLRELESLGINHAIVNMQYPNELERLEVFKEEIIPAVTR